jgi:RNA polymerase sigma factor (sigma-70 family)
MEQTKPNCSVENCCNVAQTKGLCKEHYAKQYYEKNKEKLKEYGRQYYEKNKEKISELNKKKYVEKKAIKDQQVTQDVTSLHKNAVYSLANRLRTYVGGDQFEDLVQEGYIGLLESQQEFDSNRGVKFLTYAYWNIRKKMQEYIRRYATTVKAPTFGKSIIVNELVELADAEGLEDAVQARIKLSNVLNRLNDKAIGIIRLYLLGYSYNEISEQSDLGSPVRVRQIVMENIKKCQRVLNRRRVS